MSAATADGRHSARTGLFLGGTAWLFLLGAMDVQAAQPLPQAEAVAWLQKMADAARRLPYEGTFVVRQGDDMRTLSISNRPTGLSHESHHESRLVALDGDLREVRCNQTGAVTLKPEGSQIRMERRLNSRHFPDLLPAHPATLANWYEVRLGETARVAGQDCRNVEILPKDAFRWGYVLCAEKDSGLPLKAMVINTHHRPLMHYVFAEVKLSAVGHPSKSQAQPERFPEIPQVARQLESEQVVAKTLPPGYSRITAVKRRLPNMPGEVEHWVFSDGLTHISLFLTPSAKPVDSVRGESTRGLVNLMRRQVGDFQATVLGDAPWPAVETIAMGLESRK